jgi:hypothetical protein
MTYYCLVKKQLFNFLLISFATIASYYIASIWGYGTRVVQSKNFFWVVAGAAFTYLFVLPLIMLLLEKDVN